MPGGRPSKFGPEVCERICHALALGASYKLAAKHGGIQYKTFNRWRKRGADGDNKFSGFADAVRRAEGEAAVKWLSHIEDAAEDGAWQAAAWKLERRYPESYSTKSRHEISGSDGGAIDIKAQHEQVHLLSQEQAAEVVEILAEAGALDANSKLLPGGE